MTVILCYSSPLERRVALNADFTIMQSLQSILVRARRKSPTVVIHYHIFKNAGSSIDRLLHESFGPCWTSFEGSHPTDIQSADALRKFLAERPGLCAVSSHLARPPLPSDNCVPIILLRDPIDRARSVFHFIRRDPTQPHHHATTNGFPAFVSWALDNPRASVPIFDYQVYHLSDASFRPDNPELASTAQDLAQARALIASLPAFGLVRRFAESCALLATHYTPLLPALRLYDVRENTSPETARTEAQSLAAARDELGTDLFARLCNANQRDAGLYDFAGNQFARLTDGIHAMEPVRLMS